jgi:hypothetical protein
MNLYFFYKIYFLLIILEYVNIISNFHFFYKNWASVQPAITKYLEHVSETT